MSALSGFLSGLPPQMRDPVLLAIPFFLLLLTLEWTAARKLERLTAEAADTARPASGAHLTRDSVASISMGLVSVATTAGWKTLALLGYAAIYAYLAPWHLPATRWYTWVIAILGVDLLYYAYHRIAHRVRLIWATHQAHHSSEYYNFATALRQKWNNSGEILMWIPLPLLGIPPWMVFFSFSVSLVYQFWIHTERIGKLPRPIEFVFNTPSHHRVHHGMDQLYLDRNYGG
ncbi:sterol desaturase family protein, partial [Mycobacterium sp.]|uniref:sterol desaturase family protein n=1 Tax=Mycobacterium sp. TaxID=1785 RepID=UPI003F7DCDB2